MRELAVMVTLFVVYRQIRYLTRDDTGAARANAGRIVDFERRLGVFSERALQDAVMHSETVITLLNRYYVAVQLPLDRRVRRVGDDASPGVVSVNSDMVRDRDLVGVGDPRGISRWRRHECSSVRLRRHAAASSDPTSTRPTPDSRWQTSSQRCRHFTSDGR